MVRPALLHCPSCGAQHVDKGKWATFDHKRHLCYGCGRFFEAPEPNVERRRGRAQESLTAAGRMQGPDVELDYTNHAGERRVRRIRPIALRYGTTPKQDTPRYVIDAIDLERDVQRSFTVAEIHSWREL